MMFVAAETSRWESGLVAAVIAALVVLVGYWWNTRTARVDRQRQLFAEAYGAVMEYREYPYIVRRRTSDGARTEITTGLSTVQANLNRFDALLRIESATVGCRYHELVADTRRIAGAAIAAGWDLPVRTAGTEMHVQDVDLSDLDSVDEAFVAAVKRHLGLLPSWVHRDRPPASPGTKGPDPASSGSPSGS